MSNQSYKFNWHLVKPYVLIGLSLILLLVVLKMRAIDGQNRITEREMSLHLNLDSRSLVKIETPYHLAKTALYEPPTETHFVVNKAARHQATQTAYGRQNRQITPTDSDGFAIYTDDSQQFIYRYALPYTGWYNSVLNGWYYIDKGRIQLDLHISRGQANHFMVVRDRWNRWGICQSPESLYLNDGQDSISLVPNTSIHYSIMNKGHSGMLLSNLPDGKASLVGTTASYVDFPMEVVAEAQVANDIWLHVYNGYEELGWMKKDPTYKAYVLTNYSERELLDTIEYIFYSELENIPGKMGASFVNHETLAQVDAYNQIFIPASTLKIYVLAELYHQYQTGQLAPEDIMTLTAENMVDGAGVITAFGEGATFTLEELVDYVVEISDNSAANTLIDAVGGGSRITPFAHYLGLLDTYVDGKYYGNEQVKFYTSPHDAAKLFALLGRSELNGAPWDEMLIEKLRKNTATTMRQALPWVDSYNKSGTGLPERNDVANFMTEYGNFAIAIYSSSWYNVDDRGSDMGRIVTRVYDAFMAIRSKLFHPYEASLGFYEGDINFNY